MANSNLPTKIDPTVETQDFPSPESMPPFIAPCRIQMLGGSMSGKSFLLKRILQFRLLIFSQNFEDIYFCVPKGFAMHQLEFIDDIEKLCPSVKIVDGYATLMGYDFKSTRASHKLVIIGKENNVWFLFMLCINYISIVNLDDQYKLVHADKEAVELFCVTSHHYNVSS